MGAQNAVNSFRVRTSAQGSTRYNQAKNSISANMAKVRQDATAYAQKSGMKMKEARAMHANINKQEANLLYGSTVGNYLQS